MAHSTQLRLGEVRRVFHLLGEVQELAKDPAVWQQHMVTGLCQMTGAKQGASIRWSGFSPDGKLTVLNFVVGGDWACPAAAEEWNQQMLYGNWRADPILDGATHLRGLAVTRLREEIVPDDAWEASETADIARLGEVDHHLVAFYRRHRDEVSGIALHTGRNEGRFGLRQRAILNLFNIELCRLYRQGKFAQFDDRPELSPRLKQVLELLLAGDGEKQVARKLKLSRYTVNDYVKSLYRRFGVNSRGELMAKFVQ